MSDLVTEMNEGPLVAPQQIERTGIRRGLLEDLALKILYLNGEMTLLQPSLNSEVGDGFIETP